MGNEAIDQQLKPKGSGRFIHTLQKEDVLTEDFIWPERGFLTLETWARSGSLYLKTRIAPELASLTEFGKIPRPDSRAAHALIQDIQQRADWGTKKYGEALRAFNGRDALVDSYQEWLDAWVYLRQHREEQAIKK